MTNKTEKAAPSQNRKVKKGQRHVKKKKRNSMSIVLLSIVVLLLFTVIAIWLIRSVFGNDKKEIDPINSEQNSSEVIKPADSVDIKALTSNFIYQTIDKIQLEKGFLANYTENSYPDNSEMVSVYSSLFNDEGLQIASAEDSEMVGNEDMLKAFNQLVCDFYESTGLRTLSIRKIYEEPAEVKYTEGYYDSYGYYIEPQPIIENKLCAGHESGLDLDLGIYLKELGGITEFDSTGDYSWIAENAYKYGFVLRYPKDADDITGYTFNAYHYRYTGRAAAAIIHDTGITFDEFQEYIKSYSFDSPLVVDTSVGCQIMYYIADSGMETTDVQIPVSSEGEPCPYIISGNNVDGYIITVAPTQEFILSYQSDISKMPSADTNNLSE